MKIKFITKLDEIKELTEQERFKLKEVVKTFLFYTNEYYLSLIDWNNPADPIKQVIIPHPGELEEHGSLDPSNEKDYTIFPGLQHKYRTTAVFLISNNCFGFCRYCFRKRIFKKEHIEILQDLSEALNYVKNHKEITNILLTGGDALALSTSKLENIIKQLRKIEHIQIIRLGTRALSYYPHRVINDPSLLEILKKYSTDGKKIYVMTHFVHPKEITPLAIEAINQLLKAGVILTNQAPLLNGINDDPEILAELFRKLSFIGVPPYYIFQCRPAVGNKPYTVPLEKGYEIFEQAKAKVSGLAKRARFVMSHASGKIEIVGKTKEHVYFKYLQAANDADYGRFLVFKRNPNAYWFDHYNEMVAAHP